MGGKLLSLYAGCQLPAEDAPDTGGELRPHFRSDHPWYPESGHPGGDECFCAGRRRHVSLTGVASIYLVDLSIMVMYDHPSVDVGSGPTRSTCTWLKRRLGTGIGCTAAADCLVVLLI